MLGRHTATNKLLENAHSAKRGSKNAQTFGTKAPGTRAGIIEDWRAGGDKRTGRKRDRNGFRDGH